MIFEALAYDDQEGQDALRKATVLANTRLRSRFAKFLDGAASLEERESRISLVREPMSETIASACEEHGIEPARIEATVLRHFLAGSTDHLKEYQFKKKDSDDDDDYDYDDSEPDVDEKAPERRQSDDPEYDEAEQQEAERNSSVRIARRPKMCPYHRELVDSSLQAGEPQYGAFAGAVGGAGHCQGGFEGTCNFKPAMVGQQYWDDRKSELEQARQQRDIELQQFKDLPIPDASAEVESTPTDMNDGEGVTNINSELEHAPSAVAEAEPMPMAASVRTADGAKPETGDSWEKRENLPDHKNDSTTGLSDQPSPKIDKKRWKPNALNADGNLPPIETDKGTAWPTRQQDVTSGPTYKSQDDEKNWRDQTDSVAEHDVDVTQGAEHDEKPAPVDGPYTWSDASTQAEPVTASVDPDKNPIREILSGGFLAPDQADQIIARYRVQ